MQGVRAFGTGNEVETVERRFDEKAARHTRDIDATMEYMRVGAIKGVVLDADGSVIHDLYGEFGVTESDAFTIDWNTPTDGQFRNVCQDIINAMEDDMGAETYDHIHAIAGKTVWKKLINHPDNIKTYLNQEEAGHLRGDLRRPFEFGDIFWERYRGSPKLPTFIGDDEVRLFPVGVPELFLTRFGPADYLETVNTIGLPRYSKQWEMQNGKGRHMEVQYNPLVLCTQPRLLRRLVQPPLRL